MNAAAYSPVYEISRGGHPESLHHGAMAAVDASGALLASYGDVNASPFLRSSAKPFQALPFVEAGGVEHYGLTARELALVCASHSGTPEHLDVLAGILEKAGLDAAAMQCGVHPPLDAASAEALSQSGGAPDPRHNNCSGKHSGMLAFAKLRGWPLDDYLDPKHPLQQVILQAVAEMCDVAVEQIALGTDGCSAPNFALPLRHAALGLARLVDPSGLPPGRAKACDQIFRAMTGHPDMVAGTGRFDTRLMQVTGGRILSKGGAEGYQAFAVRGGASGAGSGGMGVAIKIADGDARGWARPAVALEALRQLDVLSVDALAQLSEFGPGRSVRNVRDLEVGQGRPIFELQQ